MVEMMLWLSCVTIKPDYEQRAEGNPVVVTKNISSYFQKMKSRGASGCSALHKLQRVEATDPQYLVRI